MSLFLLFRTDANENTSIAFTHRPINDDELFQVKIDKLMEAGTTPLPKQDAATTKPAMLRVGLLDATAETGKQLRWTLMSSQIVQHEGETVVQQSEQFNLDDLKV